MREKKKKLKKDTLTLSNKILVAVIALVAVVLGVVSVINSFKSADIKTLTNLMSTEITAGDLETYGLIKTENKNSLLQKFEQKGADLLQGSSFSFPKYSNNSVFLGEDLAFSDKELGAFMNLVFDESVEVVKFLELNITKSDSIYVNSILQFDMSKLLRSMGANNVAGSIYLINSMKINYVNYEFSLVSNTLSINDLTGEENQETIILLNSLLKYKMEEIVFSHLSTFLTNFRIKTNTELVFNNNEVVFLVK